MNCERAHKTHDCETERRKHPKTTKRRSTKYKSDGEKRGFAECAGDGYTAHAISAGLGKEGRGGEERGKGAKDTALHFHVPSLRVFGPLQSEKVLQVGVVTPSYYHSNSPCCGVCSDCLLYLPCELTGGQRAREGLEW